MPDVFDILVRDLPDHVVAAIDATAHRLGLSRNEFLRRELVVQFGLRPNITAEDLRRAAETAADANDPRIMAKAWKTGS